MFCVLPQTPGGALKGIFLLINNYKEYCLLLPLYLEYTSHFTTFTFSNHHMKKQILFILLLTSAFSLKAQVSKYYPYPDTNAYWSMQSAYNNGSTTIITDFGVLLSGDTMVNAKTYHKLYNIIGMTTGTPIYPSGLSGIFREDTLKEKVYMLYKGADSLLYDFTRKAGDTIGIAADGGTDYIYSIDSLEVWGNYRKRLNITSTQASKTNPIICSVIEGIGNTDGPLQPELVPVPFESGSGVLCFRQNTDTLQFINGYTYFGHAPCDELAQPLSVNTLNEAVPQLTIYPNPASTDVAISYQLPQGQYNSTLQLYNTIGQLITTEQITKGSGTLHQNTLGLTNGVYYYTVSANGVIKTTSKLVVIH